MSFTLESIVTEPDRSPPRLIMFGPEGVGKTKWAIQAPKPIVIPTEQGQGRETYARFPQVGRFQDVVDAITLLLKEKHDYQTVVLDTLSRLEQLVHAEIREACRKDTKGGDIFANYGKGYKMVPPYFERLIRGLNLLKAKGMMVIVLGHSEITRFEPPDTSAYDRYSLNCHKFIRDMLFQWCDAMFLANYKVFTKEEETGFNQTRTLGVGTGQRVIYTEERPTHLAKNRFDLPYEVPMPKAFDWHGLLAAMGKLPPWGPEQAEAEQGTQQSLANEKEGTV
jgi:hypothetical protein